MAASVEPKANERRAGSVQYIGGPAAGAAARFGHAAALGFDHVAVAPPWAAAPRSRGFLTIAFEAADPAFGLAELVAAGKAAGIGVLIDVVLDRLAAESPLVREPDSQFVPPSADTLLDPRQAVDSGAADARVGSAGDVLALAAWWVPRLTAWHAAGVAGFRLVGLDAFPDAFLPGFVGALRNALPKAILLGWTPGMRRSALATLSTDTAGLLDGVFVSLPWWDWSSSWLWQEAAALGRVAPVFGVDQIPPGPRDQGDTAPADARATALAATLGAGWMHVAPFLADAAGDERVTALNDARRREAVFASPVAPLFPLGDSGAVLALLRFDGQDHRNAQRAALVVINADKTQSLPVAGAGLLPAAGGMFATFQSSAGEILTPATSFELPAGGMKIFTAAARNLVRPEAEPISKSARFAAEHWPRLAIELPTPCVDGGAFPVKRIAGEVVSVEADIIFDGHDKIAAAIKWIGPGDTAWHEVPMRSLANDRWQASFPIEAIGRHTYVVQAWRDRFETFRDELAKKSAAVVPTALEVIEGERLVQAAEARGNPALQDALRQLSMADEARKVKVLLDPFLAKQMEAADDRPFLVQSAEIPVDAERIGAGFASWYEVFPRSMSNDAARHGTFADVESHLPRIRDMGFDVLYFPPIHPIGRINRKGPNNTLTPSETDPGSPYAIGAAEGGHDALHPQLGSFEDFQHLRREAASHGLEIAIDFAVQCAPDHPWLKQHKLWFEWRPDGSIRYAENPPKKYQDIVNVDFYTDDAIPALWTALCDVVLFWAGQGIRLFRVDNPHTKPFPFWQWLIGEVRQQYPDAVFLAEAFTRPKVMYRLAKVGFSQSYTYFTWRNSKTELEAYLTELDQEAPRDFFRPHFFVNTPDINPLFLQTSGRPGFLIRAALAATLSGLWGVYNGFELCEATPLVPGKEEYIDSEKYQIRAWDWDRPGNIVAEITALNHIRKQNPALQSHRGGTFLTAHNELVLLYEKATADRSNVLLVAVCLDPFQAQEADFEVPLWAWGLPDEASVAVEDLLTGSHFTWTGKYHRLRLTPDQPYAIWRLRPVI